MYKFYLKVLFHLVVKVSVVSVFSGDTRFSRLRGHDHLGVVGEGQLSWHGESALIEWSGGDSTSEVRVGVEL